MGARKTAFRLTGAKCDILADLERVAEGLALAKTEHDRRLLTRAAIAALRNVTKRLETVLAALTEAAKRGES